MKKIIILAIIYFSIIGVLGYITYEMLMEKYPLIGLLLGIITAACISYWLKDNTIDFDLPLPKSVFSLLMFACLAIFWPITLALSMLLGALYLFAHIMRLVLPASRRERRTYQPTALKKKGPLDFINEIRRVMEE
ncbi:MAG: hypothetical protein QXT06_05805 [Candidatus Bathyarchaeia archaeon]